MSELLDPRRVKFDPRMQGAREFIGEQVAMASAAAVAQCNAEWLAALPRCEHDDPCAKTATVEVDVAGADVPFCDDHATVAIGAAHGMRDSAILPYAARVRALTTRAK